VTATNSAGSVTSATATLVVLVPTATPVFTTQPANQTVATFGTATFTSVATGTPTPTYQWKRNGIAIPGWTSATLTLEGVSANDLGTYSVVATNSFGSITSTGASLSIGSAPTTPTDPSSPTTPSTPIGAPVIVAQPANQTVATNGTAVFSVSATGNPTPTYQWKRNGIAFIGWTGATLSLEGVSTNDIGTYSVVVTNSAGSVTSTGALLSVGSTATSGAPVFTQQPANQTISPFGTAVFTATATGTPAPTYQWKRDGVSFAGWTGATLTLEGVSTNDQGYYSVTATTSAGSTTSAPALLIVKSPSTAASLVGEIDSRLVNLSVRSKAGSGSESLIAGFVVAGDAGKSVLVRASGPALAAFGVEGTLADPSLALYTGSTPLAANDDWSTAANAREFNALGQSLGAFALAAQSTDSALTKTLSAGAYTAQVTGQPGDEGVALLELYDAGRNSSARLVNVSVRTTVSADNTPIIGFAIAGTAPKRLLVRAVGPSLATFGVEGTLADPQVEVFHDGASLQRSDDWSGTEELQAAFASVGAFALSDRNSKDAAAIVTVAPGTYSLVISGANNTSGTVIVEVYELP
jgi:hypothetical protein